jgi:hypothetical protein
MPLSTVAVVIAAIAMFAIFALTQAAGGPQMRRVCSDRKTQTAPSRRRAF